MPPDNIDDLFRDKLDGHATPPDEALWARLQADAAADARPDPTAERLDQLFHQKLSAHASAPSRAVWERLEDEHLRPRPRRAAGWWPVALAAAVALLLVAGGAGLWWGFPFGNASHDPVAAQRSSRPGRVANQLPGATDAPRIAGIAAKSAQPKPLANGSVKNQQTELAATGQNAAAGQKIDAARATRRPALASTAPKARVAASQQSPRHLMEKARRPDAAAAPTPLVARAAADAAAAPASTRSFAADEPQRAAATAPVVAANPDPAPAAEIVPAAPTPIPSLASTSGVITVDVRTGADPAAQPAKSIGGALAAAPDDRRRLGGRLLQQAGHLVRGERVSLAEVTGLPENVTLRATLGGRRLTKSIQL